ncbi:MAG: secondary thiamine-phosphate synthase enzyme YjbQ [Candidatus Ranarchaeia archaeon]
MLNMKILSNDFSVSTSGEIDIIDLTPDVQNEVSKNGIQQGTVTVFVAGSTAAITTIEYEPGLLKDLPLAIERLFPKNINYNHELTWHDGNGHSHIRASFLGQSFTVPIINNKLVLGTWQQIILVELDVKPRTRKIIIQIIGE